MKWITALSAFALLLSSHLSASAAPVPAGTYDKFKAAAARRGYIKDKGLHPTLLQYSDLALSGYKNGYHERKKELFGTDQFLQILAKHKTPQEYSAAFNQFRPPRDDGNSKIVGGINHMVNAMMSAHMEYLDKPKDFQLFAKGLAVRRGKDDREESKTMKRTERLSKQGHFVKERSKDPLTQQKNALNFQDDMKTYGVEDSDDPIKFEENTRALISVHGRFKAARNYADYLDMTNKSDDFKRKAKDLRELHTKYAWKDGPPAAKKQRSNASAATTPFITSTPSAPSTSRQPSPARSTSPGRRPSTPSSPPSPRLWEMYHPSPPSPSSIGGLHASSLHQIHHPPSPEAANAAASLHHDFEHDSDYSWMAEDDWWKSLLDR